jgi:hypothetical protein
MDKRTTAPPPSGSSHAAWVVVTMIGVLVVPAILTLLTIE